MKATNNGGKRVEKTNEKTDRKMSWLGEPDLSRKSTGSLSNNIAVIKAESGLGEFSSRHTTVKKFADA